MTLDAVLVFSARSCGNLNISPSLVPWLVLYSIFGDFSVEHILRFPSGLVHSPGNGLVQSDR